MDEINKSVRKASVDAAKDMIPGSNSKRAKAISNGMIYTKRATINLDAKHKIGIDTGSLRKRLINTFKKAKNSNIKTGQKIASISYDLNKIDEKGTNPLWMQNRNSNKVAYYGGLIDWVKRKILTQGEIFRTSRKTKKGWGAKKARIFSNYDDDEKACSIANAIVWYWHYHEIPKKVSNNIYDIRKNPLAKETFEAGIKKGISKISEALSNDINNIINGKKQ